MKAVLQFRASPGFAQVVSSGAPPWLEVKIVDESDLDLFHTEVRDAHVLLHVLEPVTAEVIAGAHALRLIQKIGVGLNTIDLDAARANGVGVANMPGTNTQAVTELALALMLAALRRTVTVDRQTRAGEGWALDLQLVDAFGEVGGRTIGLVGFGATGQKLARVLDALGATVLYTATRPKPHEETGRARWRSLPDLLSQSDIVSLHLPLTSATTRLIDESAIATMKDGVVLVNTARGGLVDEQALVSALRTGKMRAAGLDVFAHEPIQPGHPLLALDNVVLSPHVAWLTPETLSRSVGVAFENCRRVRDGEPLVHEVLPYVPGRGR